MEEPTYQRARGPALRAIVWQPIIRLADQAVVGHEALARFHGLSPGDAFAWAVQQGPEAVWALDARCVTAALAQAPATGWLFVNLHALTVQRQRWPTVPAAVASRIVWELPETPGWTPAMIPPTWAVALDDVGVGHAELVRVHQVPWHFLKLDRALVAQSVHETALRTMVQALVALAAPPRRYVIAEGIETAAEAEAMRTLGVTYGQGFYWGRPQPWSARNL